MAYARAAAMIATPIGPIRVGAGDGLSDYSAGDGPETGTWHLKHEHAEGWLL